MGFRDGLVPGDSMEFGQVEVCTGVKLFIGNSLVALGWSLNLCKDLSEC